MNPSRAELPGYRVLSLSKHRVLSLSKHRMRGTSPDRLRRTLVATGLTGLVLSLAACTGDDAEPGVQPSSISIAPSNAAPRSTAPSPTTNSPDPPSSGDPNRAPSTGSIDAAEAVAAAEAAVADSSAMELSEDDEVGAGWEVILRAGDNGRVLTIGADGSVRSNRSQQLDPAQRGGVAPTVTLEQAIVVAERQVNGGQVTDAELTREDGRLLWDVSVRAADGDRELWIDPASGAVLREERD